MSNLERQTSLDLDDLDAEYGHFKNTEHSEIGGGPSSGPGAAAGVGASNKLGQDQGGDKSGATGGGIGANEPLALYDSPEAYYEDKVTFREYYDTTIRPSLTASNVRQYLRDLLPVINWLPHYNGRWFYQDMVAGITVGCVLVPQSMSYAVIATLPPQFGLYSSFVGAMIYSFFATSKDVCIGPVAVMSLQTAKAVSKVMAELPADTDITAPVVATALAFLCGLISLGLGVLRLGFLVELISSTAVAGFMTGSALNIISGQLPALMGYNKLVNTRTSTYKVIIETLKHLPDTKLDAVFGLIPLVMLYTWKWLCNSGGPRLVERYTVRGSRKQRIWSATLFYTQALRNAVIIIVFTAIAWSISHHKKKAPISLLGPVPSGLKDVGVMKLPDGLAAKIAPELPASVIVLLLEHIAIAKAFGRVNDYRVVPDQELIAIGATNLLGTFFNAYPATGSFSRSALKAKCNVSTPLSGVFSGACVLLAIYCLTSAFQYIPKATLSAVIIHAVSDLIASYKTTWSIWRLNPLDLVCFLATVFIAVFSSIENGIYFAMCWSVAVLLFKVAFPRAQFLGRVEIAELATNEGVSAGSEFAPLSKDFEKGKGVSYASGSVSSESFNAKKQGIEGGSQFVGGASNAAGAGFHTKWVPFEPYTRELNPQVPVAQPPPGVIVFRPSESWTYVNCARLYNAIFDEVVRTTRRGKVQVTSKSGRPWNDPGEWHPPKFLRKWFGKKYSDSLEQGVVSDDRPVLRVIAMDWSQVAQVDSTGLQTLHDLRKAVSKYADRQVEFHFSGIISPWIKRGLLNTGFGTVNEEHADESLLVGHKTYQVARGGATGDEEALLPQPATGVNMPFFHAEMPDFSKWDFSD